MIIDLGLSVGCLGGRQKPFRLCGRGHRDVVPHDKAP